MAYDWLAKWDCYFEVIIFFLVMSINEEMMAFCDCADYDYVGWVI